MAEHKKKKYEPKHAKPKWCGWVWTDANPLYPHQNHACGNEYDHRGPHLCSKWDCPATQ